MCSEGQAPAAPHERRAPASAAVPAGQRLLHAPTEDKPSWLQELITSLPQQHGHGTALPGPSAENSPPQ